MNLNQYKQFELSVDYQQSKRDPRAHIGLVLLNTDHTLENDWATLLAGRALQFTSRVGFSGELTVEALTAIEQNLSYAAQLVAYGLTLDVIAFACTSAAMLIGNERVSQLLNAQRPTPLPTTNPWLSTLTALRHLNAKRIAVLTPYTTEVNHPLYLNFIQAGFEVEALSALGQVEEFNVSHTAKSSMVAGIERLLEHSTPEAIFVSCTNLRILKHIPEFEQHFGLPILCSNSTLLWHALLLSGSPIDLSEAGRLFQTPITQSLVAP